MNFKDAYKSCNDDITGNREILASILGGEPKRKKQFDYRPLLACAALVMVVVFASVFGFTGTDGGKSGEPSAYIASNDAQPSADGNNEIRTAEKEDDVQTETSLNEAESRHEMSADTRNTGIESHSGEAKINHKDTRALGGGGIVADIDGAKASAEAVQKEASKSDYYQDAAGSEVQANEPVYDSFSDVMTASEGLAEDEVYTPAEETSDGYAAKKGDVEVRVFSTVPDKVHSGGGSGGAGAASIASDAETDYGEYCAYIGFDIEKKALLPLGMHFAGKPDITLEKSGGAVVGDSVLLYAISDADSQKSISIYASKSNAFASGSEAVIDGNEVQGNATVCINGVSVSIDFTNVAPDEIKNLIESLR